MPATSTVKALLLFALTPLAVGAQTTVAGNMSLFSDATVSSPATVISGLTASPDANTIVLSWTTNYASSTQASCGGMNSLPDASQNSVTSHVMPVPQLTPSTSYTCTVCSGTACQNIGAMTTAVPAST